MPRLKRNLPFILFCAGCLLLFAGLSLVAGELWLKLAGQPGAPDDDQLGGAGEPVNSLTVLLLGVDARPGETVARTDTIIVAHVEPADNRLSLLSIPRDTRVNIPRHGWDKINAANVYGGPELTAQVVSGLIGFPVKYYALTNWEGFKDIVDTLGGVTINVEKRMYYYDPVDGPAYAIDLKPGEQRLDGRKALQYVRYRNDDLGDITRTERQLKFLKALAAEVMQADTLLKLPQLIPQINKSLRTNLGLKQMITLARAAKKFDQMEIVTQTLPGRFLEQGGLSYWAVDPQQARQVALSLFKEGQVTKVVAGPTVNMDAASKTLAMESPEDQKTAADRKDVTANGKPGASSPGAGTSSGAGTGSAPGGASGSQKAGGSAGNGKEGSGSAADTGAGVGQKEGGNLGSIPAPNKSAPKPGSGTVQGSVEPGSAGGDEQAGKTDYVKIIIK